MLSWLAFIIIAVSSVAYSENTVSENTACLLCHGRTDLLKVTEDGKRIPLFVDNVALIKSAHRNKRCTQCHSDIEEVPHKGRILAVNCSKCHYSGNVSGAVSGSVLEYREGIHWKIRKTGNENAPLCRDCHGSHNIMDSKRRGSAISRHNVSSTCGKCHAKEFRIYKNSIHGKEFAQGNANAPVCINCHGSHKIANPIDRKSQIIQIQQCGNCHQEYMDSYRATYHGKISKLGFATVAKCFDCHGSHDIQRISDKRSSLSSENRVNTCRKCHPHATEKFTLYLAHSEEKNREKYPLLYYTYLFMNMLLIGTFTFFGIHTILWLQKSIREGIYRRRNGKTDKTKRLYLRFIPYHRILHVFVIVSFLMLVMTGMPIKYSATEWAQFVIRSIFGNYKIAGIIHRICAGITVGYFLAHIGFVVYYVVFKKRLKFKFFGPDSMIPNLKDLKDLIGHFKWFLNLGPKPQFDRWTYWEKFDYLAVFWGVGIIGSSGLLLWFPQFFSYFLPGWIFNIATIIHSDEALLAAGFIFTIHFFNTHLRAEKFPLDPVIFTGRISEEELMHERPLEYKRLREQGLLEEYLEKVRPVSNLFEKVTRTFGFTALIIGTSLIILIIWSSVKW